MSTAETIFVLFIVFIIALLIIVVAMTLQGVSAQELLYLEWYDRYT